MTPKAHTFPLYQRSNLYMWVYKMTPTEFLLTKNGKIIERRQILANDTDKK